MDLRERLEVIAADYYTKAMAIRTTLQLLDELEPKVKRVRAKVINNKKIHWTQTKKGKAHMKRMMKARWASGTYANKNK